jgi:hypothetical protein
MKKSFVIYCPQIVAHGRFGGLLSSLLGRITTLNIMMFSFPESAEDLLAYRKADLVFSFAPVNSRSIVCTRFMKFLCCLQRSPRLGDSATREELSQENSR